MKKIFYIIPVAALLASCSPIVYTSAPQPVYDDQSQYANQPVTDQVFYDELSPYGQWIDYPDYGYVWQPTDVDVNFRPYDTNGNWVYTDEGWTWQSDYSWGWAPFHYGRWFYDGAYGWMWMPGREWAPAWVAWGQSGDYYGWAPLPPHIGYNSSWRPNNGDWNYVNARYINQRNVNAYVERNNVTIIRNTTIINNTTIYNNNDGRGNGNNHRGFTYNRGPVVTDIERHGGDRIQPVRIGISAKPGQSLSNNQLNIYRPVIQPTSNSGDKKPSPRNVGIYRGGNSNQNNPRPGNGQYNPRPGNGQPNGQSPSPRQGQNGQGQYNPHPGNGQPNGQSPNPRQGQNGQGQYNPHPGNGQPNGQNPNPQQGQNGQGQYNPRPGNGQGNGQNPNPQQGQNGQGQYNPRPGNGQPNGQNPNPQQGQNGQGQYNPRPGEGQIVPRPVPQQGQNGQGQYNPRPGEGQVVPRPTPRQGTGQANPNPQPVQQQPRPNPVQVSPQAPRPAPVQANPNQQPVQQSPRPVVRPIVRPQQPVQVRRPQPVQPEQKPVVQQ